MSRTCEQQIYGGTPMKVVVMFVLLQKKQRHKRRCQMHHLGHSPPRVTDNHILENEQWAAPWNEQYSRDAAIEDGIAMELEQLYGRQKMFTEIFLIHNT